LDRDDEIMEVDSGNIDSEFINTESENYDKQFDNESITEVSEGEMDTTNYGNVNSNNNRTNEETDEAQISALTRKFFKGQWIDVKDTVAQWLEATVMDINIEESKIFVHYNGWFIVYLLVYLLLT
jgi:hypothetical protein